MRDARRRSPGASRDRRPDHSLPAPLTRLIGRERDVTAVREALLQPHVRVLTLVGAPGIGKTRLALEVARELLEEDAFEHGALVVPLAPLRDPELLPSAIAQVLELRGVAGRPLPETLRLALRDRHLLLLLDNFEHLLAGAALVADLLEAGSGLKVLATSRAPLHIYGEHEYPVPPLAVPHVVGPSQPDELAATASVALLVERARAVRPEFALNQQNAAAIAEMCVRLDGLPLAIELAAARIKLLPPEAILARLGSRLDLLAATEHGRPGRHRTLRAALAWSHDLLSADEQRLLRRLAAFAGGWTLEAAEQVSGIGYQVSEEAGGTLSPDTQHPTPRTLEGLAALVDQSLVQETEAADGTSRFTMLETIREYALERLEASGEAPEARRRHAAYFLALAEEAEPKLRGAEQLEWLARLDREHDNLRAALAWSQSQAGDVEAGLRLGAALWWYWELRGHWREGRAWLEGALPPGHASGRSPAEARARCGAGLLAWRERDYAAARQRLEESVALWRELGDREGLSFALGVLGLVAWSEGDSPAGRSLYEEALRICRERGDTWGMAVHLGVLGRIALRRGEAALAGAWLEESVPLARAAGDRWVMAQNLNGLGDLARGAGDYQRAGSLYAESLALSRQLQTKGTVASLLHNLGYVALHQGARRLAAARFGEGLALFRELGDALGVAECLTGLAGVAGAQGRAERAARLLGAAEGMLEAIGARISATNQADYERIVAAVRAALDVHAFEAAWADGRAMTEEQASDYARADTEPPPTAPAPSSDPLSPREREVAALVARGLTDRQIAGALIIGRRTAETHVASCLNKLGLASRAQLAAWAAGQGLAGAGQNP